MSLAQMAALTGGNNFKRPYVEEINARTPYLPSLYGQKKQDKYRDQIHDINLEKLALSKEGPKTGKSVGLCQCGAWRRPRGYE